MADSKEVAASRGEVPGWAHKTLEELSSVLDRSRVVGEAIRVGDTTIVPLFNLGFGFGLATGSGGKETSGNGFGGAVGGGGAVKSVGMLVIDKDGARLLTSDQKASGIEQLATSVSNAIDKRLASANKGKDRKNDEREP